MSSWTEQLSTRIKDAVSSIIPNRDSSNPTPPTAPPRTLRGVQSNEEELRELRSTVRRLESSRRTQLDNAVARHSKPPKDPNKIIFTPTEKRRVKAGVVGAAWTWIGGHLVATATHIGLNFFSLNSPSLAIPVGVGSAAIAAMAVGNQYRKWNRDTKRLEAEWAEDIPGLFDYSLREGIQRLGHARDQSRETTPTTDRPDRATSRREYHEQGRAAAVIEIHDHHYASSELPDNANLDFVRGYNQEWQSFHKYVVQTLTNALRKVPRTFSPEIAQELQVLLTDQYNRWKALDVSEAISYKTSAGRGLVLEDTPPINFSNPDEAAAATKLFNAYVFSSTLITEPDPEPEPELGPATTTAEIIAVEPSSPSRNRPSTGPSRPPRRAPDETTSTWEIPGTPEPPGRGIDPPTRS